MSRTKSSAVFLCKTGLFACLLASQNGFGESLNNSNEALKFALSEDRVPNAATVKLEYMKASLSSKTKQWEFTFRDQDKQYKATVGRDGQFELTKHFDEDEENSDFWSTLPDPSAIETASVYMQKAQSVIETFNSNFDAQDKATVEYTVCDPPKKDKKSKYANGCKSDKSQQWWEVVVQIKEGEKTFYRLLEFQNGEPIALSRVNVFGNWDW